MDEKFEEFVQIVRFSMAKNLFKITLSSDGEIDPDSVNLRSEFLRIAEQSAVECFRLRDQLVSTMGSYSDLLIASAATAAPISILIKSTKDIIVKWLDNRKQHVTVSLGKGRKIEVRTVSELESIIKTLDQSVTARESPEERKPPPKARPKRRTDK
jgi:hypothetical protein